MMVKFLVRLIAGNRLTVPVEIRWRFKLEPGDIYLLGLGSRTGALRSSTLGFRRVARLRCPSRSLRVRG